MTRPFRFREEWKDFGDAGRLIKPCERGNGMVRFVSYACAGVLVVALSACGGSAARTIAAQTARERSDVFTEVTGTGAIPAGYADVTITAGIKTHIEEQCRDGSNEAVHGKETYPFLVNIDGQAVLWNEKGRRHDLPVRVEGKASRDPEAGEGIRYVLEKRVRLAAGTHEVFLGLPADHQYAVTDISVQAGSAYVLTFTPVYRHKLSPSGRTSFLKGILKYRAAFSEVPR